MAEQALQGEIARLLADNAALQQQLQKPEVCRVAIKLPPFWPDKPAVWFAQVEAQFQIAGIKIDETMFNYVIAQLDQKLAAEVEDIITNPPESGQRYTKLKRELIQRLSTSEEQRVRQLISEEELGDRKPSQFLRHLRSLSGAILSDDNILRQLWLRRLPQDAQAILASQSDLPLDRIAELADKVMETLRAKHVFSCTTTSPPPLQLETLVQRIDELSRQVASLTAGSRPGRSHSRSASNYRRSRAATPASTAAKSGKGDKICWYHKKWDSKATKCTSPCNFKPQQGNDHSSQ